MTTSQIRWAAGHDWFKSSDVKKGTVTAQAEGEETVTFSSFRKMAEWAGY